MAFPSGTVEVSDSPTPVCTVPPGGVRVRNLGSSVVYFGGADVASAGDSAGYPVEPGTSEDFPGYQPKETPVVPAPASDLQGPVLYARTEQGSAGKIAFISF